MKIWIISTGIFPCPPIGYSGLEMIAWQQAKGLAAKGHQVTLVAPEGSSITDGYTLFPIKGNSGQFIGEKESYGQYWKHLKDADVILDHSWEAWSAVGREEGWLKAPVLKIMHAPVDTMYKKMPPDKTLSFVCISQDQAAHFKALYNRDCRYCHNGVDVNYYRATGVPRSDRFLFLARFSSIKGPDICIEACKKAGVSLDMIGDTQITNEPDLIHRCQEMSDGKQIRIIGNQTRSETVHWYSQAHCMIHPCKNFREPYGLAPVESQACGNPVAAWDNGAMRETIKHGETGWLVKSMEELVEVIKNCSIDSAMRKRCREWVASSFTIDMMISRYEKLCEEAIQEPW